MSVAQGHAIAAEGRHLANAVIQVAPLEAAGEEHHRVVEHVYGALPAHAHLWPGLTSAPSCHASAVRLFRTN